MFSLSILNFPAIFTRLVRVPKAGGVVSAFLIPGYTFSHHESSRKVALEVERRKQVPPQSLEEHARPFEFENNETISWNADFGHAAVLCRFAGLGSDYILKAILQHRVLFGAPELELETETATPTMFAWSDVRKAAWESFYPDRKIVSIGTPYAYAENLFSEEYIDLERTRLGKNLLVFPISDRGGAHRAFDRDALLHEMEAAKERFDAVRICLSFIDIQRGEHRFYLNRGFECVTVGYAHDWNCCGRLKSLLSICDAVATNEIDNPVGHAIMENKPVVLWDAANRHVKSDDPPRNRDFEQDAKNTEYARLRELLAGNTCFEVDDEVRGICGKYWGCDRIKSKSELRELFLEAETCYLARLAAGGPVDYKSMLESLEMLRHYGRDEEL